VTTPPRDLYEQSQNIEEALGDRQGLAVTSANLGHLAWRDGNLATAANCFRQSLQLLEELGIEQAEIQRGGRVREWLARVEAELGENEGHGR
jgi:hypothetical protein